MDNADIRGLRMRAQHLTGGPLPRPRDVVRKLCAVQAQDYLGAKWALAQRARAATDASVEQEFNEGAFLRTHILRPTWHFVAPEDIRWMLALTAPRVNAANAHPYKRLELDASIFKRTNPILTNALRDGNHLTRVELASALRRGGIEADGQRLGYILHRAELDALICSGPRRGRQFTYALLDEQAPASAPMPRHEALAELTLRYFAGHGPATARDFAWWSGLTVADVKTGIAMADTQLLRETVDGTAYWRPADADSAFAPPRGTHLLPTYDEYVIAYQDRGAIAPAKHGMTMVWDSAIVIDGRVAGSWRRTLDQKRVTIDTRLFHAHAARHRSGIAAVAKRYGAFLGLPLDLAISMEAG